MEGSARDYALLRPVAQSRPSVGMRKVSAVISAASLFAALLVLALGSTSRAVVREESAISDDLNNKFLQASGSGTSGKDFLSRLQDVWFVESNSFHKELASDATEMVGNLIIATFPDDMKEAVDVNVNPCEDFYGVCNVRARLPDVVHFAVWCRKTARITVALFVCRVRVRQMG